MMITQKGQVTIPQDIREKYGFFPHTDIAFVEEDGKVYIKKTQSRLTKLRGIARGKFTTEEIMELTRDDSH
ncbi:MAG: AbrB/MazE/SpoVT family DNA-binding domain-containing protein [Alphaproteobacteria bacterium]|nr:AbrB/MazE/SpoVT family DNA-binding domain-containing protein [Alphaproteobacteria bacterium]